MADIDSTGQLLARSELAGLCRFIMAITRDGQASYAKLAFHPPGTPVGYLEITAPRSTNAGRKPP
jgi:hypothetical protein